MAQSRVEADSILAATDKARRKPAWSDLTDGERMAIDAAVRDLQSAYHSTDHHEINAKIEALNEATRSLAENIMNTGINAALQGTKIT